MATRQLRYGSLRHRLHRFQHRRAFKLPAVPIDHEAPLTSETRRQADLVFDRMMQAGALGGYKLAEKRAYLQRVLHSLKVAHHKCGCVRFPRDLHHPECSRLRLGVIEAIIDTKLCTEFRSPPGSPQMSRLLPTGELAQHATIDPWTFDPDTTPQLVFLRDREDKEERPFDPQHPIAADAQKRLERVNAVNARFEITCERWGEWEGAYVGRRRLRPVHYALFTDSFEQHGRLYTGKHGHQSLRRIERRTIQFDGKSSVELDYSGMHPRLLYHLEGIDYQRDPYALWGKETTPPMRLLAKVLVNALINATSPEAAVSACNNAMRTKTADGQRKQGKALEDARKLRDAWEHTGLKFASMVPLVLKLHARIARHFGNDTGMRLMRIDGALALDVLSHFAEYCTPALGVHDSFVVPRRAGDELQSVMLNFYEARVGFLPVVR